MSDRLFQHIPYLHRPVPRSSSVSASSNDEREVRLPRRPLSSPLLCMFGIGWFLGCFVVSVFDPALLTLPLLIVCIISPVFALLCLIFLRLDVLLLRQEQQLAEQLYRDQERHHHTQQFIEHLDAQDRVLTTIHALQRMKHEGRYVHK